MWNEFPIIHTNVWDAFWAIPAILLGIFLLKVLFKLPESWFSTAATIIGLILSIFISHPRKLARWYFHGLFLWRRSQWNDLFDEGLVQGLSKEMNKLFISTGKIHTA